MNKFKQLCKDLDELKPSEQKAKTEIANLKRYIDSQEKYYDSIPASIRTTNTLEIIISKLAPKVTQVKKFINGDSESYKDQLEAAYVQQRMLKEECENVHTITYAYLRSNADVVSSSTSKEQELKRELEEKNQVLTDKEQEINEKKEELVDLRSNLATCKNTLKQCLEKKTEIRNKNDNTKGLQAMLKRQQNELDDIKNIQNKKDKQSSVSGGDNDDTIEQINSIIDHSESKKKENESSCLIM